MTLTSVTLTNFTVFEDARFDLCPGVNVLIGANATGKTHAMKAMYAGLCSWGVEDSLSVAAYEKFAGVYVPESGWVGRLVRRSEPRSTEFRVELRSGVEVESPSIRFIGNPGTFSASRHPGHPLRVPALYIPSREVLSMFEGFIAAYRNRELSFDETFFDLCVALSATPLRGERAEQARLLMAPLEGLLGGKVILDGTRFYVQPAGGERCEAHLVAEGVRKIATLAHLVANGSIAPGGVLFWDEPETNLNPRLITQLVDVLVGFARQGVQIVLATHDYLLSHRLSLLAEYGRVAPGTIRFFGLARGEVEGPVQVSAGDTLAALADNPIVDEFARHYDFERSLFDAGQGG